MKALWIVEYKVLLMGDLAFSALQLPSAEISKLQDDFQAFVNKTLELDRYVDVKIDERYKIISTSVMLISQSKEKLAEVCHDIATYTHEQPYLIEINLDDLN